MHSVIEQVSSWAVVGTVFSVLVGLGLGVLSMNPPHYGLARSCFTLSALILVARTGWWLSTESVLPFKTQALWTFCATQRSYPLAQEFGDRGPRGTVEPLEDRAFVAHHAGEVGRIEAAEP